MAKGFNPSDEESSLRRQVLECAYGSLAGTLPESLLPRRESERKEVLLRLAELDFKLRGGGKCGTCHAPVRSVMPTVAQDEHGVYEYECLCRRCLEAEKAYSHTVTVFFAGVIYEKFMNKRPLMARPSLGRKTSAA